MQVAQKESIVDGGNRNEFANALAAISDRYQEAVVATCDSLSCCSDGVRLGIARIYFTSGGQ